MMVAALAVAAAAVTYSKDIAPLVNDRCAMCHHTGGSAPFALETYADIKKHASQVAKVTASRYMPPWKADPIDGPFVGQHPLTDMEIATIKQWVDAGAPEGDARSAPPPRQWTEGWQLGKPDLVVTLPEPYTLQASGTDVFRIFVLPLPVEKARFVRGLEFRPGNARVVHHANIRLDRTPASRALDAADPGPGYSGLILRTADYPEGHFLGWTPGQIAPLVPRDLSWRLDPGTDLVVEIHMQPSGRPEPVQPSIGLYFGDGPPAKTAAMLRLGRQNIDIPAGDASYVITDSYEVPVDVEIQALQPHAHYRARDIMGEVKLPDGRSRELIHIRDWDFRWQHVYRFVTPPKLPRGSTLSMRYIYDNSAGNARNPEHPPKRAQWGQRSSDEMGDLWIQVLTRNEPDLVTLTQQFRAKVAAEDVRGYEAEIERRPDEAGLRDDAAMLYLELGRPEEAAEHFRRALALKGADAAAHYNLGTALTLGRHLDQAEYEYRQALRIDPAYANAHNNLGNVLLAAGKSGQAVAEFREVVRLQPQSAMAHGNLAAALAAAGEYGEAVEEVDAALKLKPQEPLASELRQRRDVYRRQVR
jgi:Flp pilus assembly protein TadD